MNGPNDTSPDRTPAEAQILDEMREHRGDEFVEQNAERILTQARLVGEL
ncbi:hypothetical protein [Halococcoides cellulosivorans]|nr:hypothetical protein [Halococcoides cellulosivorans]